MAESKVGWRVPVMTFKTRVRDESIGGENPYRWEDVTTSQLFPEGQKTLWFGLPGAFTPTCTNEQLPAFEKLYDQFLEKGIDKIYCVSINDAFVMNAWGKSLGIEKVLLLPDGSGQFTRELQSHVIKDNLGFGVRSWRYAAIADGPHITHWFEEEGKSDNCETDPYVATVPQTILDSL